MATNNIKGLGKEKRTSNKIYVERRDTTSSEEEEEEEDDAERGLGSGTESSEYEDLYDLGPSTDYSASATPSRKKKLTSKSFYGGNKVNKTPPPKLSKSAPTKQKRNRLDDKEDDQQAGTPAPKKLGQKKKIDKEQDAEMQGGVIIHLLKQIKAELRNVKRRQLEDREALGAQIAEMGDTIGTARTSLAKEQADKFTKNGVNLLHLPAKDPGQFARNALDVLFTKEELKGHLIYASKKSPKPGLDGDKVELLMDAVRVKCGEVDQRKLLETLGQKCRDKGKSKEKEQPTQDEDE